MYALKQPGATRARIFIAGLAAVIASVFVISTPGEAADPPVADPCGVITQSALADAFDLANAEKRSTVIRGPGNSAGVIHDRCRALAWSGPKPSTTKQEHRALTTGTAAKLRLETWVADESPFAENWQRNFTSKVQALTSRARKTFVESSLDGRAITLPKLGDEHAVGFLASVGALQKVRAFWWSAQNTEIVSINIVEAKTKPLIGSLKRVAERVVPAIG